MPLGSMVVVWRSWRALFLEGVASDGHAPLKGGSKVDETVFSDAVVLQGTVVQEVVSSRAQSLVGGVYLGKVLECCLEP